MEQQFLSIRTINNIQYLSIRTNLVHRKLPAVTPLGIEPSIDGTVFRISTSFCGLSSLISQIWPIILLSFLLARICSLTSVGSLLGNDWASRSTHSITHWTAAESRASRASWGEHGEHAPDGDRLCSLSLPQKRLSLAPCSGEHPGVPSLLRSSLPGLGLVVNNALGTASWFCCPLLWELSGSLYTGILQTGRDVNGWLKMEGLVTQSRKAFWSLRTWRGLVAIPTRAMISRNSSSPASQSCCTSSPPCWMKAS